MTELIKYMIRSMVVVIWMVIIYGFLMIPRLIQKTPVDTNSLRVYTWAHRIDEDMVRVFEKKTGIKVYLNYYESSEELLTKLEKMSSMDCDIMLPSGFIIEPMIKNNLIKKIDKKRCPFLKNMYPEFLGMYFDVNNDYSIPLYWDVFGIGYNHRIVGDRSVTLSMLFNKDDVVDGMIGMTEDARESIFLAARYLGFPLTGEFTSEQLTAIHDLLHQQKQWVGAYSDSGQGYFLSSETFAVVASDREIVCRQMLNNDFIKFALIPQGSMLRVDSVVLNASTQKDDKIYQFLEFLFSYDVMMHHAQKYCILPTIKKAFKDLDAKHIGVAGLYPGSDAFKQLVVFEHGLTQKALNDFWIRFKAS